MTRGYCGLSESWPEVQRSWVKFTGAWSLGVQVKTAETGYGSRGRPGDLVVLAEVEWIIGSVGKRDVLPHYCAKIPNPPAPSTPTTRCRCRCWPRWPRAPHDPITVRIEINVDPRDEPGRRRLGL